MVKTLSKQVHGKDAGGNFYERELDVAVSLARAAGAAALEHYGGPLRIVHKSENDDPVTQADTAANDIIVAGLGREFASDGLLSEETLDTVRRLSLSRVWMVDPLDGTKGFIEGNGDFAVQIGLVEDGTPVVGVVYQPVSDVLHYAARGAGAWVVRPETEPEQLRVSEETKLARMRLAASRNHHSPRMNTVMRALGLREEIRRGSVGIKTGLIAERQCDLYIHLSPRTKHWDTCAPEAILTEAGGRLTDLWGEPLRYNTEDVQNRNGLVAANGAAHPLVIARLAPLLDEFGRTRVS
ncbi:MAG TPA: 3'(2'),5'-bisphosphate nucleotidase CysQ [Pyrinomonadaceae bacterium]|nr:3'(2'),5'-bisphosphate nucleotidase CysQ [Pyrinomonadaceae bacterium]